MKSRFNIPLYDFSLGLLDGVLEHLLEWCTEFHDLILTLFDHFTESLLLITTWLSTVVLSEPSILPLDVHSVSLEVGTDVLEVGLVAEGLARSSRLLLIRCIASLLIFLLFFLLELIDLLDKLFVAHLELELVQFGSVDLVL